MDNKEFINEYKREFDSIKASDDLRRSVMDLKPQSRKRVVTPFKATIGTVAAAIMIFAAVNEYKFEPDTSGVISETVVSTQLPDAEFVIVEKKTPTQAPKTQTSTPMKESMTLVTPEPKKTDVPTIQPTEPSATQKPTEAIEEAEPVEIAINYETVTPRMGGGGGRASDPTIAMWTIDDYYNYLGVNISNRIGARYTGTQQIEMHITADNVPIEDAIALPYITATGASLRITVSKNALFNSSLSGTVTEAGNGFNAYKVSGGVYYNIYATNTTEEEVVSVINLL